MKYLEDKEEEKVFTPVWQKSTEELKETIGDFENQLKEHKENIPSTVHGQMRAMNDGKLPDCGSRFLLDRGITVWYLENGWLQTETPKLGEKRKWQTTTKYILDGISGKEETLDELQHRRNYAEEEAIKGGDPEIAEMYRKEQQDKIDAMRKKLMVKLSV